VSLKNQLARYILLAPTKITFCSWFFDWFFISAALARYFSGLEHALKQCCGAKTFCFPSGSDFQKVSAPAPATAPEPAPTLAFYLPFITDFILKSWFFMFFMKEYQPNSHAGFYTI
jgi:hypothetical protein